MPKRITIAPHLSQEELESRYRHAKDPVERSHYQIIWLLACGRPTEEVAAITGVAEFKYDSARKRNGFVFEIMQ